MFKIKRTGKKRYDDLVVRHEIDEASAPGWCDLALIEAYGRGPFEIHVKSGADQEEVFPSKGDHTGHALLLHVPADADITVHRQERKTGRFTRIETVYRQR